MRGVFAIMRIIFCDDNIEILNQLQKYVQEFFKGLGGPMPDFAAYTSGDELLANETSADIAFLDVEMPGKSGIYVGARLKEKNPKIKNIIVTSYPDYLDEAMRFQVFRYLSKPIDKNRLFRNLNDAVRQYNIDTAEIPINTPNGITVLSAERIVCVELLQRKTSVYTLDGTIQSTDSIEHWRSVLTLPCFYSTYRSYIVNMRYVCEIKRDLVVLKYGGQVKEAYLARRRFSEFSGRYLAYLESIK